MVGLQASLEADARPQRKDTLLPWALRRLSRPPNGVNEISSVPALLPLPPQNFSDADRVGLPATFPT